MNTMMIFITVYAACHLAEDILKSVFKWLDRWNKEKLRKRNREISEKDAVRFYWSLLEYELALLGYNESRYSRKYDTMTFIGSESSIAIGADGTIYDCVTDDDSVTDCEFAEITQLVHIVMEVTGLWRKSVPISVDDMFGRRILVRIGNTALAAKRSVFSGMDYTLLTHDGKTYSDEQALGTDYVFAKEEFTLNLLKDNVRFLPEDEVRTLKSEVISHLLELANNRRKLMRVH